MRGGKGGEAPLQQQQQPICNTGFCPHSILLQQLRLTWHGVQRALQRQLLPAPKLLWAQHPLQHRWRQRGATLGVGAPAGAGHGAGGVSASSSLSSAALTGMPAPQAQQLPASAVVARPCPCAAAQLRPLPPTRLSRSTLPSAT